ncbi:MAG: hypothetical protein ACFFER_15115 [Candidatus Thorarchaeota archaeon]
MSEIQSLSAFEKGILENLNVIVREIRTLNDAIRFSIRLDRAKLVKYALDVFGRSKKRAEVFLAINASSAATEIAEELGMKQPNVSAESRILADSGLILPCKKIGKGCIYGKSPFFDNLGWEEILKDRHTNSDDSQKPI